MSHPTDPTTTDVSGWNRQGAMCPTLALTTKSTSACWLGFNVSLGKSWQEGGEKLVGWLRAGGRCVFFAGRGGPGWNISISEGFFALFEVASQKLASQNLM